MEAPLLAPILRAFAQLDDPALLGVLVQSILVSALCFGGLAVGSVWLVHQLVAHGTLGWIVGALGGALSLFAALWLFVPIAVVIAGLFMEPVCRAVERRWYPNLPPARPAGLLVQGWDGLVVGVQVLGLSLISLVVSAFSAGLGAPLGWLVTAWAVGRGLFCAVAMRRMDRRRALSFYNRVRWAVLAQGALLTLGGTAPVLNLLLPVVGTAAMVHVMQLNFHKIDTWG